MSPVKISVISLSVPALLSLAAKFSPLYKMYVELLPDVVDKGSVAAPCIHQHELALFIQQHGVRLGQNLQYSIVQYSTVQHGLRLGQNLAVEVAIVRR